MTNINNSHLLNRESDSNKIYIYWKIDSKSFAILIPRYCYTIVNIFIAFAIDHHIYGN